MKKLSSARLALALAGITSLSVAVAAPVAYTIDPDHTHPSFEGDHMGGLSVWRGMFKKTTGKIIYDKEAKSGSVEVVIDMNSVETGNDELNAHAKAPDFFDTQNFPTATYTGKLVFSGDRPTELQGILMMHGVTRPLTLKIDSFLCKISPLTKAEVCGANAIGTFNRDDFGIAFAKQYGFKMETNLRIQVEAKPPGTGNPL